MRTSSEKIEQFDDMELDVEMSQKASDDWAWTILPSDKEKFISNLELTTEQRKQIECEEQRGEKWFDYRRDRLTASLFGEAAGHSVGTSEKSKIQALLKKMLYPVKFTNAAIEHGIRCEPYAFQDTQLLLHNHFRKQGAKFVSLNEIGLVVDKERPYLGGSADGILTVVWDYRGNIRTRRSNIEIKCPQQMYTETPWKYYDQFQGVSAIVGAEASEFIVWSPEKVEIKMYEFNRVYWEQELLPKLDDFYIHQYIPNAIWKQRGLLNEKEKQVLVQRVVF